MQTGEGCHKDAGELDWTWEELERQRDCSARWDSSAMALDSVVDDWTWEEIERQRDCSARWDAGALLIAFDAPAPAGSTAACSGAAVIETLPPAPARRKDVAAALAAYAARPDDPASARVRPVRGGGL